MSKIEPGTDTEDLNLEYTGVWVYAPVLVVVPAVAGELAEQNIDHAVMYSWRDEAWSTLEYDDAIVGVVALRLDPIEMLFMAPNGTVYRRFKGKDYEEEIDTGDEGPSDLVHMRDIRMIDGKVFAVGMGRHAYVRGSGGTWTAIDETCFVPRAKRKKAVGFNAVAGFSAKDAYAVGLKGEIWHYDGKKWTQQDSPTNVALTSVMCAANGTVYVVGLAGTVLKGQRGKWSVIDHQAADGHFWSVRIFKGEVYVSGDDGVFRLKDDDLEHIKLKKRGEVSTAYLDANDKEMWSAGRNEIFRTRDGRTWTEGPKP